MPCWLLKDPLKWDFLDISLTTFSQSVISEIKKLSGSSFDSKCLKFNVDFKKAAKNSEKVYCFWDHCIWIGIVKLFQLRTRYFSSAANMLTSSPKIWLANKRDLFQLNLLGSDWWIWLRCCDADYNSAWARLPCCFSKGSPKREFLDFYLTMFWESTISEIKSCEGHLFDQNFQNLI